MRLVIKSAFAGLVLCSSHLAAQSGWSPWNFPTGASTPPGQAQTFTPIEVFPRSGDPGYNSTRICPRVSGLFGFVDTLGTADPNDDREYIAIGRSDGVFLADVTPAANAVIAASLPATNLVYFVEEQNALRELSLDPVLNGGATWPPYCGNGSYAWDTRDTPNRELTVYYDGSADTFTIYAVSTRRPGIWVLPLIRETTGPNVGRLKISTAALDVWLTPPVGGANLGAGHNISVDQQHGQLFVTDDTNSKVHVFAIPPGNPAGIGAPVLSYAVSGSSFHDTLVKNGKLWVSVWGSASVLPRVDVFQLPITSSSVIVASYSSTYATNGHSCYVDETPAPTPGLWIVAEDPGSISTRHNIDWLSIAVPGGQSIANIPYLAKPSFSYPAGEQPSLVHNLRGMGRTGFTANYTDGILLVDLSSPDGMVVLAGFDITSAAFPSPYTTWQVGSGANQFPNEGTKDLYIILDNYRGAWDLNPYQDSGLVKVAGGEKGAIVFRVNHGQPNRYWSSTPFPGPNSTTPSASPGVYPQIVTPYGPARANMPLTIMDGHKDQLATSSASGQPVRYRWWLAYTRSPNPPTVSTSPWTNQGVTRQVAFNLDVNQPFTFVKNPSYGSDVFYFSSAGSAGDPYYFQMFVEEEEQNPQGQWVSTGAWAASRGTWIGVVP